MASAGSSTGLSSLMVGTGSLRESKATRQPQPPPTISPAFLLRHPLLPRIRHLARKVAMAGSIRAVYRRLRLLDSWGRYGAGHWARWRPDRRSFNSVGGAVDGLSIPMEATGNSRASKATRLRLPPPTISLQRPQLPRIRYLDRKVGMAGSIRAVHPLCRLPRRLDSWATLRRRPLDSLAV